MTQTARRTKPKAWNRSAIWARGKTVEIGSYWRVPERLFDDPDEMVDWARAALAAGQRAAHRKEPKRARVGARKPGARQRR
jgi:DNA transformation protein